MDKDSSVPARAASKRCTWHPLKHWCRQVWREGVFCAVGAVCNGGMQVACTCLQEKTKAWQQSFGMKLALKVEELTGDVESADAAHLEDADIICTTPEKLGAPVRPMVHAFSLSSQSWGTYRYTPYINLCCAGHADTITRRKKDQGGARFLGEVTLAWRLMHGQWLQGIL